MLKYPRDLGRLKFPREVGAAAHLRVLQIAPQRAHQQRDRARLRDALPPHLGRLVGAVDE